MGGIKLGSTRRRNIVRVDRYSVDRDIYFLQIKGFLSRIGIVSQKERKQEDGFIRETGGF